MTQPMKTINREMLPDVERYLHKLAHYLGDLPERSPRAIITTYLYELFTEDISSPFLESVVPLGQVKTLITNVSTLLIQRINASPEEERIPLLGNMEYRLHLANQLLTVIVEVLLPEAITGPFVRTMIVYEVLSREPLDEDLTEIDIQVAEGKISGRWVEVREENIDGATMVELLKAHCGNPALFGLDEEGNAIDEELIEDAERHHAVFNSIQNSTLATSTNGVVPYREKG